MSITNLGIGGVLTFGVGGALEGMRRAASGFNDVAGHALKAAKAVGSVGKAVAGIGATFLPFTAAVGYSEKQAIDFEHQMRAVQAISGAQGAEFDRLAAKAKRMGATTQFSATESAQAMEEMARAGANSREIIEGLGGVMYAAAADGMGLAEATSIITIAIRGMGLQFSDAAHVADILALTSARTNTNITELGYALTYSTANARTIGMDINELTAALGKMADAGLKGSLGGTSLTQMFSKLQHPTKEGSALMAQWGISLTTSTGKLLPLSDILDQFMRRINAIKDPIQRGAAMNALFGERGKKAYAALAAQGGAALEELRQALVSANGEAQKMAETRIDSVTGQWIILKSALEGFSIETFSPLLGAAKKTLTDLSNLVGGVVQAMQILRGGALDDIMGPVTKDTMDARAAWAGLSSDVKSFARGVNEGVDFVVNVFHRLKESVISSGGVLEQWLGSDMIQTLARVGTAFALLAAAAAPFLVAIGGGLVLFSTVAVPAIEAVMGVVAGFAGLLSGPVLVGIAALAIGFFSLQREGETIGQMMLRVWGVVRDVVVSVWDEGVKPFIDGLTTAFAPALDALKEAWQRVSTSLTFIFSDLFDYFTAGSSNTTTDWLEVGRTVGAVLGSAVATAATVFSYLFQGFALVATTAVKFGHIILDFIVTPLRWIWNLAKQTTVALLEIATGSVMDGFKRLGKAFLDFIVEPFRSFLRIFVNLSDALNMPVPDSVRSMLTREIAGPILPEKEKPKPGDVLAAKTKTEATSANPKLEANVTLEDKREVNVNVPVKIDGQRVAVATAKHNKEISDRAGFRSTPWQRRMVLEHGAVALTPTGG